MVGIHNLYWYYGSQTYEVIEDGDTKLVYSSEAFRGSVMFTTCKCNTNIVIQNTLNATRVLQFLMHACGVLYWHSFSLDM